MWPEGKGSWASQTGRRQLGPDERARRRRRIVREEGARPVAAAAGGRRRVRPWAEAAAEGEQLATEFAQEGEPARYQQSEIEVCQWGDRGSEI